MTTGALGSGVPAERGGGVGDGVGLGVGVGVGEEMGVGLGELFSSSELVSWSGLAVGLGVGLLFPFFRGVEEREAFLFRGVLSGVLLTLGLALASGLGFGVGLAVGPASSLSASSAAFGVGEAFLAVALAFGVGLAVGEGEDAPGTIFISSRAFRNISLFSSSVTPCAAHARTQPSSKRRTRRRTRRMLSGGFRLSRGGKIALMHGGFAP
jgi:hypothetical protein